MEEGEDISNGITKRSFLKALLLGSAAALFPSIAFGKIGHLPEGIEYIKYKKQLVLRIIIRKGDNYESIADIYTGKENNANEIRFFNDNKKLNFGDLIYIPINLVLNDIRIVLDKRRFITYEISEQGEPGINSLWELIHDFTHHDKLDFYQRRRIILAINPGIPLDGLLLNGQQVLIPESLVNIQTLEPKSSHKKPKTPQQEIQKPGEIKKNRQNPFRTSTRHILENLEKRDLFHARRSRSLGGHHYMISVHKGFDLRAPIGTPLYPIEDGILIYIGREPDRKLWRNGIIVQYKTNSGLIVKYCHLSWINKKLKAGEKIILTSLLGKVGVTGNASRDNQHVHIGVRIPGQNEPVDPAPYLGLPRSENLKLSLKE